MYSRSSTIPAMVERLLVKPCRFSDRAWAIINNKNSQTDKQIELKIGNERVSNPSRIADEFNTFLTSIGADQGLGQSQRIPPLAQSPAASMALAPVTEEEIASRCSFVNRLPNSIKSVNMPKAFKARVKSSFIRAAFYNTDEFLTHNWETAELAD
ncbi:hypothetical protein J6590_020914 [Homalodisca vitripennis]|nr:hypothetical protein J6590_020914 [Homalodisca vitripennis]